MSRKEKEEKVAHSKTQDEAFHNHIKNFITSPTFFTRLEANEHARHFYLETNIVKASSE